MGMTLGQGILYALIFPGVALSISQLHDLTKDVDSCKELTDPACMGGWITEVRSHLTDEFGALVGIAIAAFFGSAQPLLLSFPLERPVFLREYSSNMYSTVSYFVAKTIVELCVTLMQNLALWVIVFWVMGFRCGLVGFVSLVLVTWLMACSAASMALWIGCVVSSPSSAVALSPAISVPQILFSGLFVKSSALPFYLRWIQYVCSLKYAINLMCIIDFDQTNVQGPDGKTFDVGAITLQFQDIHPDLFWTYVLILVGIFVGFRALALYSLQKKGQYVF